jgi:hypothetical protein
MTYFKPHVSISRWTSAIWSETEGDEVPIYVGKYGSDVLGGVCLLTGIKQKSATQWAGVGIDIVKWI